MDLEFFRRLKKPGDAKMVLVVIDGLGGLPAGVGGLTELETADPPNLNSLCKEGTCGMHHPVRPGITPGSTAGHLALFGYDPLKYQAGRGVVEALGINFDLKEKDIAARGNFCTVDKNGVITDRRAGRLSTGKNTELCALLGQIELPGTEVFIKPVKDYRVALVFRGGGLRAAIEGSDPGQHGRKPRKLSARHPEAVETTELLQKFLSVAEATQKIDVFGTATTQVTPYESRHKRFILMLIRILIRTGGQRDG
jgi:2,3-bisphosphoglycerate-independent phosphoglycerate mutase